MRKMTGGEKRWILYDVGNSAFTLLASIILPMYFEGMITANNGIGEADALAIWGYASSAVTLATVFLCPILGTLADYSGWKRPMFFGVAIIGVIGCAALSLPFQWILFLVIYVITKIAYSLSLVFYDSMLCDMTVPERMDKVSSQGYAWGYIGSCIPFIASIALIIFTPLPVNVSMPIAIGINALWWLVMTLPLFRAYKQVHGVPRGSHALRQGIIRLFSVFREKIPGKKSIMLFLVAFFLYIDGVYTIIDMATSFGTALGFDQTQMLIALLVTQVVAFPSAIVFGILASRVKNDILIFVCIIAYTAVALFAIQMNMVWEFWLLAVCVGLFQGGIQALSRSYFASIIPAERSGEFFGIMDIFGKGAAFFGTLSVSIVTQATGNINLGVIPIAVLFGLGLIVFAMAARSVRKYRSDISKIVSEPCVSEITDNIPENND